MTIAIMGALALFVWLMFTDETEVPDNLDI